MMDRELMLCKLHEIEEVLNSQFKYEEHVGVFSGLSGIAMFYFYYSRYLSDSSLEKKGYEIIELIFKKINTKEYAFPTYCTGIAGLAWTLNHLEEEGFLNGFDDEVLPELDAFLYSEMVLEIKKGNYDFLHGAIGYALYFVGRFKTTKSQILRKDYELKLLEFIVLLKEMSVKEGSDMLKWSSFKRDKSVNEAEEYNLSLSHGICSVAAILTKLNNFEVFKKEVKLPLVHTINYILSFENNNGSGFSIFPNTVIDYKEIKYNSRLAWCYGDLGIGLTLWHAAKSLDNNFFREKALYILENSTKRTKQEDSLLIDAGICHGSFGNAQIFSYLFKKTGSLMYKEAADFWIQDGMNKSTFENGYAGFKQWNGIKKTWVNQTTLLEGIAGIGLVLIDQLTDFESNWDECLMIS